MVYSTDFNSTLAQMFANYGFNAGPNQVQFSNPLMFLEYAPDSADEEDADDWYISGKSSALLFLILYIEDNV